MRIADVKIWIDYKYKNPVFNELPLLVFLYVKENPEELDKYLSKNVVIKDLLGFIYEQSKEIICKPLTEIVNDYVNKVCSST